jgi:hypothetical protein
MSLDGISMDHDYQDVLFTQYTIDTVIASYLAAKKRTRQYLQLITLLKREEDEWAEKIEQANQLMPEYEPLLSLRLAASQA